MHDDDNNQMHDLVAPPEKSCTEGKDSDRFLSRGKALLGAQN